MQNNVSFEYPVGAVYDIRLVMIQNTSKYRIVVIGQECTELEENYLYIIYFILSWVIYDWQTNSIYCSKAVSQMVCLISLGCHGTGNVVRVSKTDLLEGTDKYFYNDVCSKFKPELFL